MKFNTNITRTASRFQQKILRSFFANSTIFAYHRVADISHDPHQLSVSLKNFEDQIHFFSTHYNIVPLRKITHNLQQRKLDPRDIALTFDDGYADNLYNALPILEKYNAPATIFITTNYIDSTEPYYWDNAAPEKDRGYPVTRKELTTLASHPLIEIGAHTASHPNLKKIPLSKQEEEIKQSKQVLEDILKKTITSFAYPFGSKRSFSLETISIVKKMGFERACANTQKRVFHSSNTFSLPRILIRNWTAKETERFLKK